MGKGWRREGKRWEGTRKAVPIFSGGEYFPSVTHHTAAIMFTQFSLKAVQEKVIFFTWPGS